MTMSEKDQQIWRPIAILLAGIVITGLGSFMVLGRDVVTRSEVESMVPKDIVTRPQVEAMIESTGPYVRDSKMIIDKLSRIESQQDTMLKLITSGDDKE